MTEQDAKYYMAFEFILWVNDRLLRGMRHPLVDCYGDRLHDLYEVVQAVMEERYPPVFFPLRIACRHCDRDFVKQIPARDLDRYLDLPVGECRDCLDGQMVAFDLRALSSC